MGDIEGQSVKDYKQEGSIVDAQEKEQTTRQKINKKIIIAIIAVLAIIVAIIVAIITLNNKNNNGQDNGENPEDQVIIADPVDDFNKIDMESDDSNVYDVEESMSNAISVSSIWDGCIHDGEMDVDCAINNIDVMVEFNNITDERQMQMVNIQKAIVYTTAGEYERAWIILQNYNEENLANGQLHLYYSAMYNYYKAIEDEGNTKLYYEKLMSVSWEDME